MSYHNHDIPLSVRPLPPMAALAYRFAAAVLAWEQRRLTRRALSRLDKHHLQDIGLSERDAEIEAQKPFWRD